LLASQSLAWQPPSGPGRLTSSCRWLVQACWHLPLWPTQRSWVHCWGGLCCGLCSPARQASGFLKVRLPTHWIDSQCQLWPMMMLEW